MAAREWLCAENDDFGIALLTDDTQLWSLDPEPEEPPQAPEKPEKPRFVGLKFAIALELLGIAALFWWWYLWIR